MPREQKEWNDRSGKEKGWKSHLLRLSLSLSPSFFQWSRSTAAISFRSSQLSSRNLKAPKRSMPTKGSSGIAISVTSSHSQSVNSRARQVPENTHDGLDSLGSSSRTSKTLPPPRQMFLESSSSLDGGRSKENVTVTVRFRPLRFGTKFRLISLFDDECLGCHFLDGQ